MQFVFIVLSWMWENYWSFWQWAIVHPVYAICIFWVTFMAYGNLRRAWEDGSFKALHWTQQAIIIIPAAVPLIHAYVADILILRCIYGWIVFGIPPWYQDWRFWTATWTFSRLVSLLKDRSKHAKWWSEILHAIDPKGH
jgi:hypothetical protein